MVEHTVTLIASLFLLAMACQWLAWRVRLPAIFFLLLAGITAGPLLNLVEPEEIMGDLLFPFVSLSVAVILFEGSLTLKFKEVRGLHLVVRNLVSFGMIITAVISTLAARFFANVSWEVAALFGAITVVTGPTVVAPILRTVRPSQAVANILKWESIVIDPIGASLAVLVYEFIVAGRGEGFTTTLLTFLQLLLVGASTGLIAGYLLAIALRRHYIPEFLQNLATISVVFTSFALANHFQPESGLVTVTVFGVLLANMRGVDLRRILRFKETLSIMLISLLFIILAARLDLNSLTQLGWQALIILFIIQFIARPINVHASTIGSPLTMPERHFISWIGPRGIIAAAISSLFALKLLEYGYSDADLLISLTFMVIIGTVLIQSLTAIPVAKMLKVTLPDPDGVLIVGGDRIALLIGRVLAEQDIHVVIADSSIAQISKANAMGVETYLGNPLSEHARQHIETSAIGMVLALSPYESENVAVALHFQDELGKNNVFFMLSENGDMTAGPRALPRLRGKILFSNEINHDLFLSIMDSGGTIHHTTLSKELTMDEFMNNMGEVAIPLFTISPKGKTHCFTPEIALRPDTDWTILYLKKRKMD